MTGIRACAVAVGHALHGHLEGHVKEDREIPDARKLVAVEEHTIDDEHCAGR